MISPRGKHGVACSSGTVRAKKSTTSWPRTMLCQKNPRKGEQMKHNKMSTRYTCATTSTLTTRGPAADVVWNHQLDGIGARNELKHTYGNNGPEDRASKFHSLNIKMFQTRCKSQEGVQQLIIRLGNVWANYQNMGVEKEDDGTTGILLARFQEHMPSTFEVITLIRNSTYNDNKNSLLAITRYKSIRTGQRNQLRRVRRRLWQCTRARSKDRGDRFKQKGTQKTWPQPNQCEFCLKRNHRRREC
ncbi:unnamed protein product [Discosporangium mesarthrocarpum]